MPARGLCYVLAVEQRKATRDPAGQLIDDWITLRELPFAIQPLAGGEQTRGGQQLEGVVTHTLRCRYFSGATSQLRLTRGARTFHVESVINVDERSRWLEWQVREAF